MDGELRQDEERQREEKPRVDFRVEEKRDLDLSHQARPSAVESSSSGSHADHHARENAPMDQCQGIVGEARAAKQLEQRAADHEREVGGSTASGLSVCGLR